MVACPIRRGGRGTDRLADRKTGPQLRGIRLRRKLSRLRKRGLGIKPIVFEVGRSNPARDWPFIHPGPNDAWAGLRVHPRTIRFTLAEPPRGLFTLRIELVDANFLTPPRYAVSVGGRTDSFRLVPGASDSSLGDPRAGRPQKLELVMPAELSPGGRERDSPRCDRGIVGALRRDHAVERPGQGNARGGDPEPSPPVQRPSSCVATARFAGR